MTEIIAYFIAGVSTTAFLTLWFATSYKELSSKKREVEDIARQLKMHTTLHLEAQFGPDEQCAKRMLDTSRAIYNEATKSYNNTLKKAMNYVPAVVMGFHELPNDNTEN